MRDSKLDYIHNYCFFFKVDPSIFLVMLVHKITTLCQLAMLVTLTIGISNFSFTWLVRCWLTFHWKHQVLEFQANCTFVLNECGFHLSLELEMPQMNVSIRKWKCMLRHMYRLYKQQDKTIRGGNNLHLWRLPEWIIWEKPSLHSIREIKSNEKTKARRWKRKKEKKAILKHSSSGKIDRRSFFFFFPGQVTRLVICYINY